MGEVTTIGLDLATHVFQVHGVDAEERRFCASSFGVRRFWRSSVDCRPVWLTWRRARRRTTGVRGHLAEFGVIAPQGLRNVG